MKTVTRLGLIGVLMIAATAANASHQSDRVSAVPSDLRYTESDAAEVQFVHRRAFRHSHRRSFRSRGFRSRRFSRRFNGFGHRRHYYYSPYYGSRFGFHGRHRGFSRFGHGFY